MLLSIIAGGQADGHLLEMLVEVAAIKSRRAKEEEEKEEEV